jgi:tRNA-dihydrouridine synthase C
MEGITQGAFCRVMADRGLVQCWITPFIRLARGVPRRARLRERLAPYTEHGLPVVAQLMGTDERLLCASAERLIELGVVGIDLNCGCPSRTVVNGGAGGALLGRPGDLGRMLRALRDTCSGCGLSVKLRSGLEDPAETDAILDAVSGSEPDFAVFHFRTVSEEYRPVPAGEARRRLVRARERLPHTPLLGSGDLWSVNEALEIHAASGMDGVIAARGLMHNPFLLEEIRAGAGGRSAGPRDRRAGLRLLREIGECAVSEGVRRGGFLLEIAGHMLGKDDPLFLEMAAERELGAKVEVLSRAAEQDH